jgi:hypothetical protein
MGDNAEYTQYYSDSLNLSRSQEKRKLFTVHLLESKYFGNNQCDKCTNFYCQPTPYPYSNHFDCSIYLL